MLGELELTKFSPSVLAEMGPEPSVTGGFAVVSVNVTVWVGLIGAYALTVPVSV